MVHVPTQDGFKGFVIDADDEFLEALVQATVQISIRRHQRRFTDGQAHFGIGKPENAAPPYRYQQEVALFGPADINFEWHAIAKTSDAHLVS